MEIAILVLVCISLFFHIVMGIFLVRMRENHENITKDLNRRIENLTKELLVRLPPRPYGVNVEEREPALTTGPMDWRTPT